MTETVTERDEAIAERRLAGESVRSVAQQFGCSTGEVHAAVERVLEIDNEVRKRMVLLNAAKLDRLLKVFYDKGLAGCVQSAITAVRIWERKHELLGLNSPVKLDVVTMQPQEAPKSFDKIRAAVYRVARGHPGQPVIDGNGSGEQPQ